MARSPSGLGTVRLTSPIGLLGGVSFDSNPRAFVSFEVSTFRGLLRKVLERGLRGAVLTNTLGFDGPVEMADSGAAAGGGGDGVLVVVVAVLAAATWTMGNLGGGNGRL